MHMAYSETTRLRNGSDNRTCPGSLWETGIKHMQSNIKLSHELATQDMQEILYIWNVFRTTSLSYTFESVSVCLPQPRLCILALLCTKIRFLATYAIKCASWTAVSRGTSGRSACASIGHEGFASVDNSNTMASRNLWFTTIWLTIFFHVCEWGSSMQWFIVQYIYVGITNPTALSIIFSTILQLRTCLLCLLTTALGGTWAVEQPELSVLEYFPPFLALLTALYKAYGETAAPGLSFAIYIFVICHAGMVGFQIDSLADIYKYVFNLADIEIYRSRVFRVVPQGIQSQVVYAPLRITDTKAPLRVVQQQRNPGAQHGPTAWVEEAAGFRWYPQSQNLWDLQGQEWKNPL